jgi:NAD-dependent deacetylase sirtuin 2
MNLINSCDLLIVIGTALAVSPFNLLVERCPKDVKQVLINRENTVAHGFDFEKGDNKLFLKGDCDDVIKEIVKACEWDEEFDKLCSQN